MQIDAFEHQLQALCWEQCWPPMCRGHCGRGWLRQPWSGEMHLSMLSLFVSVLAHGEAEKRVALTNAVATVIRKLRDQGWPAPCRAKSAAVFAAAAVVYWAAVALDAEPLLACVTAGLVVVNRRCSSTLTPWPASAWQIASLLVPADWRTAYHA